MAREGEPAARALDRWLVHDLRQALATGVLLTEPRAADGQAAADAGRQLETVRGLLQSMMEMLATRTVPVAQQDHPLVDVAGAVRESVEVMSLGREVPVTVVALEDAEAHGDGALLRRAVRNVLDNALRAAGDDGKVTVALTTRDAQAVIEVTDTGRGFGDMPSGTGQGLASVHRAMQEWGGTLEIASGPGPGTTVRLVVPCETDSRVVDRS